MFADFLTDSTWANRSHRGLTTAVSFAIQAAVVAFLLAIPLLFPGAVPELLRREIITLPEPHFGPPPAPPHPSHFTRPQSNMLGTRLVAPASIPSTIQNVHESSAPQRPDMSGVLRGAGQGSAGNSATAQDFGDFSGAAAPPPPPAPRSIRLSHMLEGSLIREVQPVYPPIAKASGIQGTVVLQAVIGRDGGIEHLQVVSGHPILAPAAIKAVEQWHYRPYVLNGEPVEVETQITVKFMLSR